MSDLNIGKLITTEQQRDAIHVAVAPVTASHLMTAGSRIKLCRHDASKVEYAATDAIGIVDPYLTEPVEAGERFWMFMFPNTITSLRHDWTHPAFKEGPSPTHDPEGEHKRVIEGVANVCGVSYQRMMDAATEFAKDDTNYTYMGDHEAYREVQNWDEFWKAFEAITKIKPKSAGMPFSCSC